MDQGQAKLVTAVYHTAVQDAVAAKEHHGLVRSIPAQSGYRNTK